MTPEEISALPDGELDALAGETVELEPRGWHYRYGWENEAQSYTSPWPKEEAEGHRLNHIALFADEPNERGGHLVVGDLEVEWQPYSADPAASAQLKAAARECGLGSFVTAEHMDGFLAVCMEGGVCSSNGKTATIVAESEVYAIGDTEYRALAGAVVQWGFATGRLGKET